MNTYLNKFLLIKNNILSHSKKITIVVVTKSANYDKIKDIIEYGHIHFGENRIQDANKKWIDIKKNFLDIKLHFIGRLQTNKVDEAVSLFSYIHSLESEKLAVSLSKAEKNPGLYTHTNVIKTKLDMFPQQELIDMLLSL